jgi:HJR/Mrr/RecB family endonuclease
MEVLALLSLVGAFLSLVIALVSGGNIAIGALIAFIVLFFYSSYRAKIRNAEALESWVAAKQTNSEYIDHINKQREQCRQELNDECFKITDRHRHTLVKKYSQMVSKDDYGVTVGRDKWEEELSYFFENILLAEPTINETVVRCAELQEEFETAQRKFMGADELLSTPMASVYNEDVTFLRTVVSNWIEKLAQEKGEKFREVDFDTMSGVMFEIFCQETLENSGWSVVRKGGTGDQGVDLIAKREELVVAIQCKRYSKPVGNKAVQEVEAGRQFEQAHRAAVVSTADYTPAARQLASTLGVLLLHHKDLERLHEVIAL